MKIKLLILGLGLGASILAGCNDDFSSIGTSIQPGDDTSHYGAIRFYLRKVY